MCMCVCVPIVCAQSLCVLACVNSCVCMCTACVCLVVLAGVKCLINWSLQQCLQYTHPQSKSRLEQTLALTRPLITYTPVAAGDGM